MMKRLFLFVCLLLPVTVLASRNNGGIVLENDKVKVVFDGGNGAMLYLESKAAGWVIMGRECLAQSFELLLPMEGREMTDEDKRYNVVKGIEQADPEIESDGSSVTFTWSGLKTEFMKDIADITFVGRVSLTDRGLEFSGHVDNRSKYHIEYVSWPCFGEVSVPDRSQPLYQSTRNDVRELFPRQANQHGYWGVEWPTSTHILPERSFLQVNGSDRGFMIYNRTYPENLSIPSFELIPGYEIRGVNPYADEIDGEPVRLQFKMNNCVYTMPGESSDLDTVEFVPYCGSWEEGVKIYAADRQPYCNVRSENAAWMGKPQIWRRAGIENGDDLVRYAEESRRLGVDVLLVSGAFRNSSGHIVEVGGLCDAIEKCHGLGLKVVLETAWNLADRHAPGYMDTLRGYVMSDQFINLPYNYGWLCPASPHVQELAEYEWGTKESLMNADGYMNRDHNNTGHSHLCFDLDHGHRFGEPTINGAMSLDMRMARIFKAEGKVALGKGFSDYQNDIYDGYELNVPDEMFVRHRTLSPDEPMIVKVDVRNARRMLNKAVLYRLIPSYTLDFYDDRLSEYTHIVEYGNMIKAMCCRYEDRIWKADFANHEGASVDGDNLEWSVFVDENGRKSVVVANSGTEDNTFAAISVDGAGELVYVTPEDEEPAFFGGRITLAPQSLAVIMEK